MSTAMQPHQSFGDIGRREFARRFTESHRFDPTSSHWIPDEEYYDRLAPKEWETERPIRRIASTILFITVMLGGIAALVRAFTMGGW